MSDATTPVSYQPTPGLSYDPDEARYWDVAALDAEVRRTFEICQGCRMCFKFCDAFPKLFGWVDGSAAGDVRRIDAVQTRSIMDSCFQCKLCEVQCSYTVRDGHEYQLDCPRLVHRYQAVRARAEGVPFRKRLLGDPDGVGRRARRSLGMVNLLQKLAPYRWILEKALGIHRHKRLPVFASTTFERWAERAGLMHGAHGGAAVLFRT